ncbi:hypothetical protein SCOCK_100221 [Actinacidiphila cocklensis]|uniref:Uncharacterized protein n=1 Tax=Actinacidiphila cocklensis TaxID=887465 RepID=A0A9W4GNA3_9ACTN|nr:hypothetical protein SCOCK_100221 [Actinacidiphila cocklensis]
MSGPPLMALQPVRPSRTEPAGRGQLCKLHCCCHRRPKDSSAYLSFQISCRDCLIAGSGTECGDVGPCWNRRSDPARLFADRSS